jgi:hypothetical protein
MVENESTLVIDPEIAKELFRDTALGAIYLCYAKKDYQPSSEEPIVEGAVVIGEMTDIEKAMYSVGKKAADVFNGMIRAHQEAEESCNENCGNCTVNIDRNEAMRLKTIADSCMELTWGSIRRRLGAEACGDGIGLVTDYRIVRMPERKMPKGMIIGGPGDLQELLKKMAGK